MVDILARESGGLNDSFVEVSVDLDDVDDVLSHPRHPDQSFVVLKSSALQAFSAQYPDVELVGLNALIVDSPADALSSTLAFDG